METLELPAIEIEDTPPVDFSENEMDQAAFRLWQQASRLDEPEEPNR
jgi:hypothetical protein